MYENTAAFQLADSAGMYDAGQRCAKLTSQHLNLLTAHRLLTAKHVGVCVWGVFSL